MRYSHSIEWRCGWWKLRSLNNISNFTARIDCKRIRIVYLWNLNPSAKIHRWNYWWYSIHVVRLNIFVQISVGTATSDKIPIYFHYLGNATKRKDIQLRDIGVWSGTLLISKSWIWFSWKRKGCGTVRTNMAKISFVFKHFEATNKFCLPWFTEQ